MLRDAAPVEEAILADALVEEAELVPCELVAVGEVIVVMRSVVKVFVEDGGVIVVKRSVVNVFV